mmetsp:Transcript_3572/g.9735  ORF Transcript_3572/g.9735 Transcript_3572/m.9735 type:complete len:198 (-) Transcript_3572:141-734(-)
MAGKRALGALYELRTYSVYPEHFPSFVKLTNEHIDKRLAYSKLVGYWSAELGGINQTVHLWEYESFEARAEVRKELTFDKPWNEEYMNRMRPMIHQQDNATLQVIQGGEYLDATGKSSPSSFYSIMAIPQPVSIADATIFNMTAGPTVGQTIILAAHDDWNDYEAHAKEVERDSRATIPNANISAKILSPFPFSPLR